MNTSFFRYYILFIALFFCVSTNYAQKNPIDSLKATLKNVPDSQKVKNLNKIAFLSLKNSNKECIDYCNKAIEIAQKHNYVVEEGKAWYYIGIAHYNDANYDKAVENYQKSIDVLLKGKEKKFAANIYSDIGVVYKKRGLYDKAIETYLKALKIQENIKDKRGQGLTLGNIGTVYLYWIKKDSSSVSESTKKEYKYYYDKALENYKKAADIFTELKQDILLATILVNIGFIHKEKEEYEKALKYYGDALSLYEKKGYLSGMADCNTNMSELYTKKEDYDKAIVYSKKALTTFGLLNLEERIPNVLQTLGDIYKRKKDYPRALDYLKQSIEKYKKSNRPKETSDMYKDISEVYALMNDYQNAYETLKEHKKLLDSISREDMHKQIVDMEIKYGTEKKQQQLALQSESIKRQDAEIKRKGQQRNFLIGGFLSVILFLGVLYKQFSEKKKANILLEKQNIVLEQQNEEIKHQSDKIFEQNQNITDSILYASRIQNAILPPAEIMRNALPEHFILFNPRDIVSGDFYWMTQKDNKTIVVAADCTGHGVPGAFMSMLGVSFLNEIVIKKEILTANEILNELRESVMRSLHQTGKDNEAKDGMDISLCILDFENNHLEFAGAYNSMYVVRDNQLTEIDADKMPIGIYFKSGKPFTNTTYDLQKGDMLYMCSDGYVDQFGGDEGKKFMSKRFKRLLEEINQESMEAQKERLQKEHMVWRGGKYEQVDDMLVIGIRI